jgi:hypothetical protein
MHRQTLSNKRICDPKQRSSCTFFTRHVKLLVSHAKTLYMRLQSKSYGVDLWSRLDKRAMSSLLYISEIGKAKGEGSGLGLDMMARGLAGKGGRCTVRWKGRRAMTHKTSSAVW